MTEIRAKDVTVKKLFRACCHLRGCGWIGTEHATFAGASTEREAHITRHRLAMQDADHDTPAPSGGEEVGHAMRTDPQAFARELMQMCTRLRQVQDEWADGETKIDHPVSKELAVTMADTIALLQEMRACLPSVRMAGR